MSLQDDLASIQASENSIDTSLSQVGTELDQVQVNVQTILGQIVSAPDQTTISALAQQASAEVAKLGTIKAALDTLNTSTQQNVVVVPPVEETLKH